MKKQLENKFHELKQWSLTFGAEVMNEVLVDILFGLGTLAQTGDLQLSAVVALCQATLRTAIKKFISKSREKISQILQK